MNRLPEKQNLDAIIAEANNVLQLNNESLDRSIGHLDVSIKIGSVINPMLDIQSDKLQRINNGHNNIANNIVRTDNLIDEMQCCCVRLFSRKKRQIKKYKHNFSEEQTKPTVSARNNTRVGNVCSNEQDKIEIISNRVGELKLIALEMGEKIESNNCIIDEIIAKSDNNNRKINRSVVKMSTL